jgi:alpha-tubulin suppressor-like RCC1 family protein
MKTKVIHMQRIYSLGLFTMFAAACGDNVAATPSALDAATPNMVDAGSARAVRISTIATHTCAIDASNVLRCWGDNTRGQIGVGSGQGVTIATPTIVDGAYRYLEVSAGINATCAIRTDRSLYCWGANDATPDAGVRALPTRVGLDADWEAISVGANVSCGIRDHGVLYCWNGVALPKVALSGGPAVREISLNYYGAIALDALGSSYLAALDTPTLGASPFQYAPMMPKAVHVAMPVFDALAIDGEGHVVRFRRLLPLETSQGSTEYLSVSGAHDIVAVATNGTIHFHASSNEPLNLREVPALGDGWVDARVNAMGSICAIDIDQAVWCFTLSNDGQVVAKSRMIAGRSN